MLSSLYIQNYALIEKLDINFETGFSVITGETGAGKSIILGAIGLLLGQRADAKLIRRGAKKSIIEARFNIGNYGMQSFFDENQLEYDEDCILRREISDSGKSRAFINDTPASLNQMRELGERLIDVHSQHQNLLLNKEGFQLNVLDILSHNEVTLSAYSESYAAWRKTEKELADLIDLAEKSRSDEDFIRFQLEQLEEAQLRSGEQGELEAEFETLSHAEDIKAVLYKVEQIFSDDERGVLPLLKEGVNGINSLRKIFRPSEELAERFESSYIEIKDVYQEIASLADSVEFNPERLTQVNERLNLIYSLQQKHRVQTLDELLTLKNDYEKQLLAITSYDESIDRLRTKVDEKRMQTQALADKLTDSRTKAAQKVEGDLIGRLLPLGMPNVCFKVEIGRKKELGLHGQDHVNFLFSANKNVPLQNITSVASGGEIARVMLSIKAMIAGAVKLPTIVFDEIDTGVSGEIADRMADIMHEMGECNRQVISITHLPQIAARGLVHYKVYKQDSAETTISYIRRLTTDERVEELAQMLSGSTLTEAALSNAKALLRLS